MPLSPRSSPAGPSPSAGSLVEVRHRHLHVDLLYASDRNFTGRALFDETRVLLHPDAAAALLRAADLAAAAELHLLVYDAFRPAALQEAFWAIRPDPTYVADPRIGSDHTRGIAVDLTLCDAAGKALDLGTAFDAAEACSHHGPVAIPAFAHRNRLLLAGLMILSGFVANPFEWWHYSLPKGAAYPLLPDQD